MASVVTKMADKGDLLTFCCAFCGNSGDLRRCARCKDVYYCSREHQKQDWKVHKKNCSPKSTVKTENDENCVKVIPTVCHLGDGTQPVLKEQSHTDNTVQSTLSTKNSCKGESNSTNQPQSPPIPLPYEPIHVEDKNRKESPTREENATPAKPAAEEEDSDGVPFDIEPFQQTDFPKPPAYTFDGLAEFAAKGLLKDGYCVIDGIMTPSDCDRVLKEMETLHEGGGMTDGKLAGGRTSGDESRMKINKGIRSDKIKWLDGTEDDEYPAICGLVSETMDSLVGGMNMHLEDHIKGRTKAMAACYPGGGSNYHKHIDNPRKDGRRITCIMYLNKDWDVQASGGFLRIYPSSLPAGGFVDVAPVMNRLLVFWSDDRNPHAVHPAHRTRYAVTVWYFDEEERMAAKADQADKDLANVREELVIMDIAKKQLEKDILEQRIENESRKALNKLDPSELQAIYGMMALHPSPNAMLEELGILGPIRKLLLYDFRAQQK